MNATELTNFGALQVLDPREVSRPTCADQMLVRVAACGACHDNLHRTGQGFYGAQRPD